MKPISAIEDTTIIGNVGDTATSIEDKEIDIIYFKVYTNLSFSKYEYDFVDMNV